MEMKRGERAQLTSTSSCCREPQLGLEKVDVSQADPWGKVSVALDGHEL